ncbi:MAG: hypothetical protein GEU28_06540 [Dehalococcoidia bacterium]|nr:hypothetical protein [Dehalococcoidia bacterium]
MQISVIGGNDAPPEIVHLAREVGRLLAERGVTVVCGGGEGVMLGACQGAAEAGGHTVGILPGRTAADTPPNPFVEFVVYTGVGYARNSFVALSGEAVIAIDGALGTLSEIAFALMWDIPVVGLKTWEFNYAGFDPTRIIRVETAKEAVDVALAKAAARGTPKPTILPPPQLDR